MEIIVEDFWCLMGLGQIKNNEPYFHFWHVTSIISNKIVYIIPYTLCQKIHTT